MSAKAPRSAPLPAAPESPSRGRTSRRSPSLVRTGLSRRAGQVYRHPERRERGETEPHPGSTRAEGLAPQPSGGRGSRERAAFGGRGRLSPLTPSSPRNRCLQTRRRFRGPRPSMSRCPSAASPSLKGLWGSFLAPRRPPPPFGMARAPPGTCPPGECDGRPRPLLGLALGAWCCWCCPGLSGGDSLFLPRVGTTISA